MSPKDQFLQMRPAILAALTAREADLKAALAAVLAGKQPSDQSILQAALSFTLGEIQAHKAGQQTGPATDGNN